METKPTKPRKVITTLSITKQAQDIMLDNGYASARTMGSFISDLIVEYHKRKTGTYTPEELAQEIHRLVDLLAERST
jgi:hypothetical protein